MKLPGATTDFLKRVTKQFPKTPYKGGLAIAEFKKRRYLYGCDENIQDEQWVRYPHQVRKYMTCQESGIYNYLIAKQLGLDVLLLRMENSNETNQSHLGALIQGTNKSYLLSNDDLFIVKNISSNQITYTNEGAPDNFSSLAIISENELEELFEEGSKPEYFLNFFSKGQLTSTYTESIEEQSLFHRTNRSFKIEGDELLLRKSTNFPGYFIHLDFSTKGVKEIFSSGLNNTQLINPIELIQAIEGKNELIPIEKEIEKKLQEVYYRSFLASVYTPNEYKRVRPSAKIERPYSKRQKNELVRFEVASQLSQQFNMEDVHKHLKPKTLETFKNPVKSMHQDFAFCQKKDAQSYHGNRQRELISTLESYSQKYGLKITRAK